MATTQKIRRRDRAGREALARPRTRGSAEADLEQIEDLARQRQYQTYALLGILSFVAGGSVAAGVLVANPVFWIAAGAVFFLSSAGIVAWAAKQLGIIAELIALFRIYREQGQANGRRSPRNSADNDDEMDLRNGATNGVMDTSARAHYPP